MPWDISQEYNVAPMHRVEEPRKIGVRVWSIGVGETVSEPFFAVAHQSGVQCGIHALGSA